VGDGVGDGASAGASAGGCEGVGEDDGVGCVRARLDTCSAWTFYKLDSALVRDAAAVFPEVWFSCDIDLLFGSVRVCVVWGGDQQQT
jgi:hypothetical protein